MNKRIVRITALIAMFFVSVTLAAVFAFVKPAGAQAEASGATAWGTEIEDCLYRKGEWGDADTTDFTEDSGATANGFEKSYVKTLDAGTEISGQFSHASIKAEYTEVRFAIKTVNGRFRVDDFSASDSRVWLKAYDDWAYFVLTRADAGWEIKVYFGNELVHETVNADGKDFVCSILWHQAPKGMIVYPDDSSKEMTVYCTELRAAKEVPLSMVEGASLRIDDEEGGIRFRAKMNEKTAASVKDGSTVMNFVIAPKALFDTVTDGNYANLTKKIEIPVDGTKVYKDGDYYYANGVIANILEANRSLDFCATAYITANGTTTYAEADFSLTRGNLYDIVNQLVVIYGKEYAESILAATPYEWYGKGDYPIVIDTVEQYNALAAQVNGGRDFSAYTAKIASGVKSATDKTEITKPEFFPQVKETGYDTSAYTDKIMECAGTYNASNNNGFEATTEVASPSGFENVFKSVSCSGFDFGHSQSLDGYVKVCFALKSDGKYKHSTAGEIDGNGKWVYFELLRETSSSHDWKIRLIGEENNVLFETGRTDTNGFNTVCGVLWHGGAWFEMSGTTYVYCTELLGAKEPKQSYDTSVYTDKIMECAGTVDSSNNNGFEATTEVAAPSGFENAFKSSSISFNFGCSQQLVGYVKVCFALKSDGKYKHSTAGEIDGNGKWVYFELSRETASSHDWKIRLIDEDNNVLFEADRTDTNGFNTVCGVLYHGGAWFDMSGATYVYCTELLGEPEDRYNNNSAKYTESHDFSRTATQNYLVKDGATEYTVVIPSNPDTYIDYAKSELVSLFLKATGIELNVLTGADTAHTPSGKYISLGETRLFATSGLSVDKTLLGRDGVRILTKDLSVYITGGSERGVLYGVYDFLKMNFGYEVYAKDCYTIDTGVTELPLYDYDVTDIPDISLRVRAGMAFNLTEENDDVMFASRMRTLDDYNYLLLPIYEEFDNENSEWSRYHNGFHYLPKSEYETAHPEFYSDDGTQLCYTAHGNSESFELMTDLCARKAEQSLTWWLPERFPEMNTVHIGVQDVRTACDCATCKAFKASHNDSNAAAILKFVNRMGEKVVAWMNKEENAAYKRENLTFSFFVYQETLTPPFTVNADGTVNIAEDLVSPEGVTVRPYTAFSDLIYFKSVDDEANAEELKKVEQWSAYVKDGWAWTYGCFFNDYFCFYDFYPFYKDYFGKIYDLGYGYAFPQFHSEQRGADTGFYTLANYLTSKLSWNSSLDADELIADYFDKAYGPAAKKMREFYDECRSWFAKTAASQNWNAESINARVTTDSACFAYADVQKFFGLLDEAYAAIESLKTTDSARYETLKSHIDLEWLFPAKVALTLYQGNYDSATLSAMKTKFKSLCEGFGMTKIGESESIDEFINSL